MNARLYDSRLLASEVDGLDAESQFWLRDGFSLFMASANVAHRDMTRQIYESMLQSLGCLLLGEFSPKFPVTLVVLCAFTLSQQKTQHYKGICLCYL